MSLDLLGPNGALATAMPDYEDRPGQRAMARAIFRALTEDRSLLVEAGTGTGKTLAYLVPALLSGKRVVVSTGTKTLQDQIARHDVPVLESLLDKPFTAVFLKGITNYLCQRRYGEALTLPLLPQAARELALVDEWAPGTATGDRSELNLAEDSPLWPSIGATPETRLGPRCPYFERCHVTRARRAADKADLIVVNHHLFFADLALRRAYPGARVLPEYDAVIFDEAHLVEDVITEHFSIQVSTLRASKLSREIRELGLRLEGAGAESDKTLTERIIPSFERSCSTLFKEIRAVLQRNGTHDQGRIALPAELFADHGIEDAWFRVDNALAEIGASLDHKSNQDDSPLAEEALSLAKRSGSLRNDLATLAERSEDRFVYWGETRGKTTAIKAAPIEVADLVNRELTATVPTIFTSATLRSDGHFDHVRQRLGLSEDEVEELTVPSPFDYTEQALIYIASDLPAPREPAFLDVACKRIRELLTITEGHSLVLFTSHRALSHASRVLQGSIPYPMLIQGQAPRSALLERFRETPHSVLFATGSFWQGVDVPGDALSQVIMDKLPFAPPDDPLLAARARAVEARGGQSFRDFQLPSAVLTFKQGFGRLIRRRSDRGLVSILDGRVTAKSYGRTFLASLPDGVVRTSSVERARQWWNHG